jgi:hypothetical protein
MFEGSVKVFDYGDKVQGSVDGEVLRRGEIVDIDFDSDWPYMVWDREADLYGVYTADELDVWADGT